MKKVKDKNSNEGWAIHCLFNTFIIKYQHGANLFDLLSPNAVSEIPEAYREAAKEVWKTSEASAKAWRVWTEAVETWEEAHFAWPETDRQAWHKKWCGCKESNWEARVRKLT